MNQKGHPPCLESSLLKDPPASGQEVLEASSVLTIVDEVFSLSVSKMETSSGSDSMVAAETMWHGLALLLSLDFLQVTVVHCSSSSSRSGYTHMIPPLGMRTDTNPFSYIDAGQC